MRIITLFACMASTVLILGSCKKVEQPLPADPVQPGSITQPIASASSYKLFPTPNQSIFYWANTLNQNCNASNTSYVFGGQDITWQIPGIHCNADCSGLLNKLLKQTYNASSSEFTDWWEIDRPHADTYHDAIAASNKFVRRTNIVDVKPGDVIAVKYLGGQDGEGTGHVMIAAATPVLRNPTAPFIYFPYSWSVTKQYDVSVIDVAKSGHGAADPRNIDDYMGIGKGSIRIYTDVSGNNFIGYTWSTTSTTFYYQNSRKLEIGMFKL